MNHVMWPHGTHTATEIFLKWPFTFWSTTEDPTKISRQVSIALLIWNVEAVSEQSTIATILQFREIRKASVQSQAKLSRLWLSAVSQCLRQMLGQSLARLQPHSCPLAWVKWDDAALKDFEWYLRGRSPTLRDLSPFFSQNSTAIYLRFGKSEPITIFFNSSDEKVPKFSRNR